MTTVLVVDDERDLAEYLADELEFAGYGAKVAHDGVEAVLAVLQGGVDAVVMDIRMPNLNGIYALKIMKQINPNLPVIMFTGQAGQGDMYESTRLGAFTCLLKPIDTDYLLNSLKTALTS